MRGPVKAPITLTILRKGVDEPFDVKMIRDLIHINPVKYDAEDDVGYIRITRSMRRPRRICRRRSRT
jgi:carboxyl-terminal processing protease